MKISKLLKNKNLYEYSIDNLQDNSNYVNSKSLFFAIKGNVYNGADFIEECINKSCKNIITNDYNAYLKYKKMFKRINLFYYKDINKIKAIVCRRFYKDITRKLYLIGITGTNGKTTTSTLLYKYLRNLNIKACLIGTNGVYINDNYFKENNTTPDILKLYKYFNLSYKNKVKYVIMEVSSHAISLKRVKGIKYKIKALTNITKDHLDFHKNFENYKKTKEKWMNSDNFTRFLIKNSSSEKINFFEWGIYKKKIFKKQFWDKISIKINDFSLFGTNFQIISNKLSSYGTYKTNMICDFNMENICLFVSVLKVINKLDIYCLKKFFEKKIIIDGRLNYYNVCKRNVIIDFAHSPDGIEKILKFFNSLNSNIISICGCGGNRDKSKRKIIGNLLSYNSKYSIFTSDNPRNEDAFDIINQMMIDIKDNVFVNVCRKEAIKKAFELSKEGDYILILGKGNENAQILKNEIIYKSDYDLLEEVVGELYG